MSSTVKPQYTGANAPRVSQIDRAAKHRTFVLA